MLAVLQLLLLPVSLVTIQRFVHIQLSLSFPLNVPVFWADDYIPNFHICTFSSDPILGALERQKWFAFHCVSHCSTFGIWELSSK